MVLSDARLDDIKGALETGLLASGSLYQGNVRLLLARGLDLHFLAGLPVIAAPGLQLDSDLSIFNSVERLVDGSVPLEIWLRNAARMLRAQKEVAVLQQALDETSTWMSGAPPMLDPTAPDLPPGSLPEGLELAIDRDDTLPFLFIAGAQRVGAAVARLGVPEYMNGLVRLKGAEPIVHVGTGWLVTSDLLMTNWHVVNARSEGEPAASPADLDLQAKALSAHFNYDALDLAGQVVKAQKLEASNATLDYALVRLSETVPGAAPLTLVTEKLQVESTADYVAVNIIQHPGGNAKRVAIRNNLIYRAKYPSVSYFTDTDGGSSGAPVCTDDWRVVALHRAWKAVQNVNFQGRPTAWINEGTQIAAIVEDLQQHHAALYAEIAD